MALVRIWTALLLVAGVGLATETRGAERAKAVTPNILLIVADDLGWADVGWHGSRHQTPVLDGLARGGVELDQFYVQPVCTPTRAALLGGRWTSRFGPQALAPSNRRVFEPGTSTLASLLKSAGYKTFLTGKWHLGSRPEWGPNHYGFDHSYGTLTGAADPWTHQYRPGPYAKTWHRDGKLFEEEGNVTELISRQAVEWIRSASAPWFIYVPFHAVHIPVDAPEVYKERYQDVKFHEDPAYDDAARRFAAFVTQMDAEIGEMVAALEATGQRTNTLILFHSDNGGLLQGKNAYISEVAGSPALSSNLPLRGQKNTLYEGGVRVCAFANWPGHLEARKMETPMHAVDWTPTLATVAGYARPKEIKWDGQDMWPLLVGEKTNAKPRVIYIPHETGAVIRHGDWKLIAFKQGERRELFHLGTDPFEKKNLSDANPGKVSELEGVLQKLRKNDVTTLPPDLEGTPK